MKKIKIITDSTCDLPLDIITKYDIEVIPLIVNFDERSYLDGVELTSEEFFKKMKESSKLPTTSQITPQRFHDYYNKYIEQGYDIFSIHLSSKMSGTYQSACIAKEMLLKGNIEIVDSQNVTVGLGALVIKAFLLKEEGFSLSEMAEKVKSSINCVKSALIFDKLDNLVKGGRLSKTAGIVGSLLGIKLLLEVKDGEMNLFDKVRGTKKAIKTVIDTLDKNEYDKEVPILLLHVGDEEILNSIRGELVSRSINYVVCNVGCVVGVHSGPSACGIFFMSR